MVVFVADEWVRPEIRDGDYALPLRRDPEIERLRAVIGQAVAELDAEHRPTWASPTAEAAGKEPVGCVICFPADGSWPCVSRMVADDLRACLTT